MDDRDFVDHLFQVWAKTPGAENTYWMPELYEDGGWWDLYAVGQDESRKRVASHLSEEAADFISAIHGCLPDLVRRLHMALDEADRADYDRDSRECRIAELELALDEEKRISDCLGEQLDAVLLENQELRDQERRAR